jgi:hypothetical protein
MRELKWTEAEKNLSRRAFEMALQTESRGPAGTQGARGGRTDSRRHVVR